MCGIAGVFTLQPLESHRSNIERIIESQYARGPDRQAVETVEALKTGEAFVGRRGHAILGHNRLAIIDLSPTGDQPMWDVDHQVCIVFNGEIYNFVEIRNDLLALGRRFAGTSDTEVILEAFKEWGIDAVERFNGMFAFGLFDARDGRLYLVRDRFGVKPLYYAAKNDAVYFASTPNCMAALLGLSPNMTYIACGLRYGLFEHDAVAPYDGMKSLAPGHWMKIEADDHADLTLNVVRYYDLQKRAESRIHSLASLSLESVVATMAETLEDAVKIRLRADVPVGVSLSGGLDSTTVTALAAGFPHEHLQGFSFGAPDENQSEGPVIARFSRAAGIDVTYVWPSLDEIGDAYEITLRTQAGPFGGGSIVAQQMVFQAARAAGFKVLLGGQGADEAFMGYRKFQAFRLRRLASREKYFAMLGFAMTLLPTVWAERWRWRQSWRQRNRYLKRSGMATVLQLPPCDMEIGYSESATSRERQILDVSLASLPTLLRFEDGNSMGNSVESRLPFMDYRLVECGIALPEDWKLRGGHGKWIIRRVMKGRIPEMIRTSRRKMGFDVQQNRWIDGGLGRRIRRMLHDRETAVRRWLAPNSNIDTLFDDRTLKDRPLALCEASSLIWLADASGGR
jgi:asparagine synthase (glutamine-hydrolysing)